ncbi:hypothetical protein [Lysinibacter cavernae]|uniref:Uncharacterized protein n=1 Tax=Lysinibacter cavernae TaxID=1640652 RepID=A0A7X5TST9_9MICO|nr:hypothetical protein [Lysinibacter cavernae]NIH52809.1 hypothetical protein [Lysinibacter cavernae]
MKDTVAPYPELILFDTPPVTDAETLAKIHALASAETVALNVYVDVFVVVALQLPFAIFPVEFLIESL